MAVKGLLKEKNTGDTLYPVTTTDVVFCSDGMTIKEKYATKQYADEAAAEIVNSSPEQLQVINILGNKLGDDDNLANVVTKTIADSKKALFIDMWNEACVFNNVKYGQYNYETGYFELNGLTDITYTEAINILKYAPLCQSRMNLTHRFNRLNMRTLLPIILTYDLSAAIGSNYDFGGLCSAIRELEIVQFLPENHQYGSIKSLNRAFDTCTNLREVRGYLNIASATDLNLCFQYCPSLESFWFVGLNLDLKLNGCPKIKYETLKFLVENRSTANKAIKVVLHNDVFSAIAGETEYPFNGGTQEQWTELNELAISKNITFATS